MINSEISFFFVGTETPPDDDLFLEAIGLSQRERDVYLEALNKALTETRGRIRSFKKQFLFRLTKGKKTYSCALISNLSPIKYTYITVETFFSSKKLKQQLIEAWHERIPEGWFLELENFKGYSKVYLGDLKLLKRYLLQDDNIPSISLPYQIGFKDEESRENFRWHEIE
jgi:hypothetical protein